MAEIDGRHGVAMLQRRDADQQVGEADGYALGALFPVDLAGQQRRRFSLGNHHRVGQKIADKTLVVLALNGIRRALDGVNEFGESHGGERDPLATRRLGDPP